MTADPVGKAAVERLGHRPGLDGLRAVAVTLVVLQHTGDFLVSDDGPSLTGGPFLPGGFLGVDLFFVLSGFLITTLLLEEHRRSGRIAFAHFYERRALRLLPALGVLLVGTTIWVAATGDGLRAHLRGVAAATFYVWNWAVAAGADLGDFGLGHLWSLAVEEQFYLAWPLALALLLLALRRRPAMVAVACVALACVAAVVRWRVADGAGIGDAYVRTDTRADALLIGAALGAARVSSAFSPRASRWMVAPGLVALTVLAATTSFTEAWLYRGGFTLVAVIAASVVCGVVADPSVAAGVLDHPAVVRLGTLSYTTYLLHYPVFQAVGDRLGDQAVAVRIVVAWSIAALLVVACHRLVELPFLRLKDRRAARRVAPDAAFTPG